MRDEIARGKRASDAALAVRLLLDQSRPGRARISDVLAAAEQHDPATVRQVLDRRTRELGLGQTIDEVLMPALRQIGAWWESGRCDVKQEHLMTETARGWLARVTSRLPVETYDPPILLACGPRDMHTVGLEALAALLAEQRRGCRVLGARTSELTLVSAATVTGAAAVVVISQLHTHRRVTVHALHAVADTGCPVFYAGNAFAFAGERRGLPGHIWATRSRPPATRILESLPRLVP